MRSLAAGILLFLVCGVAGAQILVDDGVKKLDESKLGHSRAQDYFKRRAQASVLDESTERAETETETYRGLGDRARFMALTLGTYINDKAYRWGREKRLEDVGNTIFGVSYRVGEWRNSMDLFFRAELTGYKIDGETPLKLSAMPVIAFPDARSEFPLYFGAGAGVGIFFEQVGEESDLTAEYAVIIGARFPELFPSGGIVAETGLRGFFNVLSSGQHDGVFFSLGGVFEF